MTLGQLVTATRGKIQEEVPDHWTDEQLRKFINSAYRDLQKAIIKVDPFAFLVVSTVNILANKSRIPLPNGFVRALLITAKESSASTAYQYVGPSKLRNTTHATGQGDAQPLRISIVGRYLILDPTPTAAITDGIKLYWTPTATLAVDADIPELLMDHEVLADRAAAHALKDFAEDRPDLEKSWASALTDIPEWYVNRTGEADAFEPTGLPDKRA